MYYSNIGDYCFVEIITHPFIHFQAHVYSGVHAGHSDRVQVIPTPHIFVISQPNM